MPELTITQQSNQSVSGFVQSENSQVPFSAVRLDSGSAELNRYQIWLAGETFTIERENASVRRAKGSKAAGSLGDIKAPMPGTVLKVLVEKGQALEANQPVVVMESMKMEMTLSASAASVVDSIDCAPGQLVDMNKVLVKLKAIN